jgi:hypothetical protein
LAYHFVRVAILFLFFAISWCVKQTLIVYRRRILLRIRTQHRNKKKQKQNLLGLIHDLIILGILPIIFLFVLYMQYISFFFLYLIERAITGLIEKLRVVFFLIKFILFPLGICLSIHLILIWFKEDKHAICGITSLMSFFLSWSEKIGAFL